MKFAFLLLHLVALTVFAATVTSCGIAVTEDGCVLGKYTRGGSTYYAGPCVGPDKDGDGEADIDRFRVQWANDSGDRLRATYTTAAGAVLLEYLADSGIWVGWSSKSGVVLGPVPPQVEKAMQGEPEPVAKPVVGVITETEA